MKRRLYLLSIIFVLAISIGLISCDNLSTDLSTQELPRLTDDFLATASEHRFEGYSIDDIRQILNDGRQIYQDFRVFYEYYGTMTYRVPVQDSEIEYLMNLHDGNVLQSTNRFPVTKIRCKACIVPCGHGPCSNTNLSHQGIVIILLGDAFSTVQYGTWPDPATGTVLYHANNVINALFATHPFNLFSHLLTVYVIHSTGINPVTGLNGYLGTVDANGILTSASVRQPRIRQLADDIVLTQNQTMIQVISNSRVSGTLGFAWNVWHYQLHLNIAVTSISNGTNPIGGSFYPWPNGTRWHAVFIHEHGHSFGNLVDEHGSRNIYGNYTARRDELRANSTRAVDANVKWRHWFGHRNVLTTPLRFTDGWAVPSGNRCMMHGINTPSRVFCGVCTAELVRRMALISRETFHGRRPETTAPLPNTPNVTIPQGATRILDSAFHGNRSLQTISIPSTVTEIGDFAFIGATGLRTITIQGTNPPRIYDNTFAGLNRANITVNVWPGTIPAFRNTDWTGFRFNYHFSGLFAGGTGTTFDPFRISTPQQLQNIAFVLGGFFVLMYDIDMGGINWTPIPAFSGILNGNDRTINNLRVNIAAPPNPVYMRFFGGFTTVNYGEINRLNISSDIFVTDTTSTKTHAGVFAGINYGRIYRARSLGSWSGYKLTIFTTGTRNFSSWNTTVKAGGIAGYNTYGGEIIFSESWSAIYVFANRHFTAGGHSDPFGIAGVNHGLLYFNDHVGVIDVNLGGPGQGPATHRTIRGMSPAAVENLWFNNQPLPGW